MPETNQEQFTFTVDADAADSRLDQFLALRLKEHHFSRNQVQKWIKAGTILCDGIQSVPAHPLRGGETITVKIPQEEAGAVPEKIPLDILYEDRVLLAINKPAGMLTHPAGNQYQGTVANAVAYRIQHESKKIRAAFRRIEGLRPGIVHRLDRDTSGVMVIAKTTSAMEALAVQFREREVTKVYHAIVCGRMETKKGEIEGAIGKAYRSQKMTITSAGRSSRTDFKALKLFPRHTYLEVYPKTGRTHQIRVHLSKIGYPILGDRIYGTPDERAPRQMLHAYHLTIRHPVTKKILTFKALLPDDFLKTLKELKKG